jgi:hypothetical protein
MIQKEQEHSTIDEDEEWDELDDGEAHDDRRSKIPSPEPDQAPLSGGLKPPNDRHFYAYRRGQAVRSGLNIDYIKFQNTVILPGTDVAGDVAAINAGQAKYKELLYIPVHSIPILNLRIALSFGLYLCIISVLSGNTNSAILVYFAATWAYAWVGTRIAMMFYRFVGESRAPIASLVWNIIFVIILISTWWGYQGGGMHLGNIFFHALYLIFALLITPYVVTWLAMINVKNMRRVKVEPEWSVNQNVYGGHLNKKHEMVLYPKRGSSFYLLDPDEYKKLIAYREAGGDRAKAKVMLQVWRSKPLATEFDQKLMLTQKYNLLRQLMNLGVGLSTTLFALIFGALGRRSNHPVFRMLEDRCKKLSFNRVFWIYQDCESAKRLMP